MSEQYSVNYSNVAASRRIPIERRAAAHFSAYVDKAKQFRLYAKRVAILE